MQSFEVHSASFSTRAASLPMRHVVTATERDSENERYLCAGLIRLHVLHHAIEGPIYGLEMIEELAHHGYRLSAGTLYPILHELAERGLLVRSEVQVGRARRRMYNATPRGRKALKKAKVRVRELFRELIDDVAD